MYQSCICIHVSTCDRFVLYLYFFCWQQWVTTYPTASFASGHTRPMACDTFGMGDGDDVVNGQDCEDGDGDGGKDDESDHGENC